VTTTPVLIISKLIAWFEKLGTFRLLLHLFDLKRREQELTQLDVLGFFSPLSVS
jgi:hypothetical protein